MPSYEEMKNEINTKMDTLRNDMKRLGETFFKEQSASLFSDFPDLNSYSWTQYTPYFNDGDVCEFHVHGDYDLRATKLDGTSYENRYGETYLEVPYKESVTDGEGIAKRISLIVSSIDEDVMKSLFGDHVRVTVYRDKTIETETWEHD